MPSDREASTDAVTPAPAIEIHSLAVSEAGGRRTVTATLGSSADATTTPVSATTDLLHRLYSGRASTRTEQPAAASTSATPMPRRGDSSSSWWDPFGSGDTTTAGPQPSPSGWATDEFGGAHADRSKEYRQVADNAKAGKNQLPPDAKDYIYLVVPGLFAEHYPGYMKDNLARMKKLGLDARVVTIDTDASVADNAKVIRDAIKQIADQEGKEVVLLGHSKGGVDATAALAKYPDLYQHVRAVIAMQSPYGGTPIASDIASNSRLIGLVSAAIKRLFNGDVNALTDLSYQARQQFVRANPYDASKVATVSYATTGGPAVSTVGPAAQYMRTTYGLESDGLVPKKDAMIPGSEAVYDDDQDHASPVMGVIGRGGADVPADITEALITIALRRASEMDAAERAGGGN